MANAEFSSPRALHEETPTVAHKKVVLPKKSAPPTRPENLVLIEELDTRMVDFADYARTLLNHSDASVRWYQRSYKNYRDFLLEEGDQEETLFRVRMHSVEEWIRWNRRRGLSPITTNTYWRGLRRFFEDLEKRHGRSNPFQGQKQPQMQRPIPKAKSGDDCRRILEAAYNYPWPEPHVAYKRTLAHAAIGVMLLAGLRRGEVVRLKFADIALFEGTIHIVNGKGIAGGRDRMAYISPDLREILIRYLRERDRLGITQPELFISLKTRRGLSLEGLRKIVEKIRQASGIRFSAHVLRHSFITHLLRSDVPIHITRELAGHRDIATTLGYLRIFDEDLHKNIRKIRFA